MVAKWTLKNTAGETALENGSNSWDDAAHEMISSGEENLLWENREFFNLDFSGITATRMYFYKCNFNKVNMSGYTADTNEYKECEFEKVNFANATFKNTKSFNTLFDNCNFVEVGDFQFIADNCTFKNIDFSYPILNMNITDKIFTSCKFTSCKFDYQAIQNTDFSESEFNNCSFINTNIDSCTLEYSKFNDCTFNEVSDFVSIPNFNKINFTFKINVHWSYLDNWKKNNPS